LLGGTLAPDGRDNGARSRCQCSDHGSHQEDEPAREAIRLEQTPYDTEGRRHQEEGLCNFHGASLRAARCTGKTQIDSRGTTTVRSVVVMVTGGMHVAVLQLFFGRHPNVRDFDIEVQILAGQRVIPIQGHHVALDLRHCDRLRALRRLRV
jgi:hypothetical protein